MLVSKKQKIVFLSLILLVIVVGLGVFIAIKNRPIKSLYTHIVDFDVLYLQDKKKMKSIELIDTITYDLSKDNPKGIYELESKDNNMIFEFTETENLVNFFIASKDDDLNNIQINGGTSGNSGIYVNARTDNTAYFGYTLGYKANEKDSVIVNKDLDNYSRGKINVYKVK